MLTRACKAEVFRAELRAAGLRKAELQHSRYVQGCAGELADKTTSTASNESPRNFARSPERSFVRQLQNLGCAELDCAAWPCRATRRASLLQIWAVQSCECQAMQTTLFPRNPSPRFRENTHPSKRSQLHLEFLGCLDRFPPSVAPPPPPPASPRTTPLRSQGIAQRAAAEERQGIQSAARTSNVRLALALRSLGAFGCVGFSDPF